jgi:hypothetical protein
MPYSSPYIKRESLRTGNVVIAGLVANVTIAELRQAVQTAVWAVMDEI